MQNHTKSCKIRGKPTKNDQQSDQEIDRRSLSDCITFIVLRDHDLIGDHIFPSDRDHENGDRPELCFFYYCSETIKF